MAKRSKNPRDLNSLAAQIVESSTTDAPQPEKEPGSGKNPAAVELGKLGGQKGGRARASKLTAEQRSEIARNAARERWSRQA